MNTVCELQEADALNLLSRDRVANCGALYNLTQFGFGWALRNGNGIAACSAQPSPMLHFNGCTQEDFDRLVEGIADRRKDVGIAGIPAPYMAAGMQTIAQAIGKTAYAPFTCNKYDYDAAKGKPEILPLKQGYFLRPLSLSDVPYLMAHSKYVDLDGESYVAQCVAKGPAIGIEAPDGLAAWSYRHDDGSIGCLNCREHHRRQGLARAVMAAMVSSVMELGGIPVVQIEPANAASTALAQGMGFSRSGTISWVRFE